YDTRFVFPPGLREFVLVLRPRFTTSERVHSNSVLVTLMSLIVAAVTAAEQDIKVTIVGADRLSPLVFGSSKEKFDDPADAVEA
ncbi:hypothetical protein Q0O45_13455, partial [Staphylococcus aureus]|nr:hypothetical protein [Staphylococcus aureus]